MDEFKETGFWVGVIGLAGALLWNILGYVRKPAFVRAGRIEEMASTIAMLRADLEAAVRRHESMIAEIDALTKKNEVLMVRVNILMGDNEWWRERYVESEKARRGGT
jgi:hypothetical protein